jgi:hypothetical protein
VAGENIRPARGSATRIRGGAAMVASCERGLSLASHDSSVLRTVGCTVINYSTLVHISTFDCRLGRNSRWIVR